MNRNTPQYLVKEVLNSKKSFVHGWFVGCMDSNMVQLNSVKFDGCINYNRVTKKCSVRTRKQGEIVFKTLNDVYRLARGMKINPDKI